MNKRDTFVFCSNCNQHAVGWPTGTDCISFTRAHNELFRSVVFLTSAFTLYIAQGPWVVQNLVSFILTIIPLVSLPPSLVSPVS